MEAKSLERKQTSMGKLKKDSMVEVVDDEIEEEEEEEAGGGGGGEDEKKGVVGGGRRGSSGGGGVSLPSCQAESCGADLSNAKRYHRRHKVCEFHSKAPVVMVAGLRQRFCQQCSRCSSQAFFPDVNFRFHDLAEFDETKRSCRRRLAGHNERRRKSLLECHSVGCSRSKGHHHHHHPKENQCRHGDERGRIQMNIPGNSGYKSFHIS